MFSDTESLSKYKSLIPSREPNNTFFLSMSIGIKAVVVIVAIINWGIKK